MIKQISVFLENKSGRLIRIAQILGEAKINIRGLSIADTSDFGILRLIVDQPDKAVNELKNNDIMATLTDVIAIEVPDRPGGLAEVLIHLHQAGINIEYIYSLIDKPTQNAMIMMRVEQIDNALEVLKQNKVPIVNSKKIYTF